MDSPHNDPSRPASDVDDTRTAKVLGLSTFWKGDLLCERFRVVRFIARGGMGELYEAEDLALGERVALKTIRPEIASDQRMDQRFRREVQLARRVTHPNICRILRSLPASTTATCGKVRLPRFSSRWNCGGPDSGPASATNRCPDRRAGACQLSRNGRQRSPRARGGLVHRDFKSKQHHAARCRASRRSTSGCRHRLWSCPQSERFNRRHHLGRGGARGTPDYMAPGAESRVPGNPRHRRLCAWHRALTKWDGGKRPSLQTRQWPLHSVGSRTSTADRRAARAHSSTDRWDRVIMRSVLARDPENRFPRTRR